MRLGRIFARMRQRAHLALMLLSVAAAMVIYLPALYFPFIADDNDYLVNNAKLTGLHLSELWRLLLEPYNPWEFLPLRDLSYWLDFTWFGLHPAAFRMHNLMLYLLCCALVYGATRGVWRCFRAADNASAPWVAAIVTALFAIHPAHVEAVVWISGRKDLLCGMFSLLAIWLAVSAKREQGLSAPHAAAALLALLAAMLSKATAVALAPVIAMLWVIFWRDSSTGAAALVKARKGGARVNPSRHYVLLLWPLASLVLAACATVIFASHSTVKADAYFGLEIITRALAVLGWLARLALSAESRQFFYPVFEDANLPLMVAAGAAVAAAAAAGMVMLWRRRSLEGWAVAAFVLLCLPYTQLIPYDTFSLVSDRFLALALWPLLLLLVALSWRLQAVPRTVILLAIALPWCFQSVHRLHAWSSDEALIESELRAYPGHYQPAFQQIIGIQIPQAMYAEASALTNTITAPELRQIMAGIIQVDAARAATAASGNPQPAMALLMKLGQDLNQPPTQARWNSPMTYVWNSCRNIFAIEWDDLVKHFPDDVLVRYNAGLSLLDARKDENAVVYLRAATESPGLPQALRGTAYKSLGIALLNSGHAGAAEAPLRSALEQSPPDLQAHCVLADVYKQTGRLADAARAEAECHSRVPAEKPVQ